MYRKKDRMGQREAKIVSLEDLVPQNHLLRKIEAAINFDFIYDEVKGMYSELDWGKPGLDPITLFKIVFIQYLFGIRMRHTVCYVQRKRQSQAHLTGNKKATITGGGSKASRSHWISQG